MLPRSGGSAAVWITCMVFYQTTLLLGYVYAHWTSSSLPRRAQALVHVGLIGITLAALPMVARDVQFWGIGDPVLRIICLLAATVGAPYFLLSTTSPLLQTWYARTQKSAVPYRLYAVSNAGSLLALLAYPAVVEPFIGIRFQARAWVVLYTCFAVLCAYLTLRASRASSEYPGRESGNYDGFETNGEFTNRSHNILWLILPACASALMLAITAHLTENIAAMPFLWVLPLSLYLLSFMALRRNS